MGCAFCVAFACLPCKLLIQLIQGIHFCILALRLDLRYVMAQPDISNLPHYTWDDYQIWEGAWELIDGIPYAITPALSILHPAISQKIAALFDRTLADCRSCQSLLPVDW